MRAAVVGAGTGGGVGVARRGAAGRAAGMPYKLKKEKVRSGARAGLSEPVRGLQGRGAAGGWAGRSVGDPGAAR